jgi:CHAT domain-containing protein
MYAGAARGSNLWQVEDEATAELMRLFYQRMLGNNICAWPPHCAAQIEMRNGQIGVCLTIGIHAAR